MKNYGLLYIKLEKEGLNVPKSGEEIILTKIDVSWNKKRTRIHNQQCPLKVCESTMAFDSDC